MKKIFLIIFGVFLISLISAFPICVDKTPPSAPSNLILTKVSNGIQLTWNPATDVPNCSGIDYYDIYRGFNGESLSLVGNPTSPSFLDNINPQVGTYTYIVHAWDLAGHNEGNGISNTLTISGPPPSGGGGGGGSRTSFWECGEWSECINETQERTCEDINRLQADRIETKECVPEFIPTGQE